MLNKRTDAKCPSHFGASAQRMREEERSRDSALNRVEPHLTGQRNLKVGWPHSIPYTVKLENPVSSWPRHGMATELQLPEGLLILRQLHVRDQPLHHLIHGPVVHCGKRQQVKFWLQNASTTWTYHRSPWPSHWPHFKCLTSPSPISHKSSV